MYHPLNALFDLQRALDSRLDSDWLRGATAGTGAFPPINVFSDKDGFTVRAEVPGIKAEELSLDVEPGRLSLSGERKFDPHADGGYHRRERRGGVFSRTLRLPPDLDTHAAKAELVDGILTVQIPKAETAKPRHIEVKAA